MKKSELNKILFSGFKKEFSSLGFKKVNMGIFESLAIIPTSLFFPHMNDGAIYTVEQGS
ncbi:MAG TPA: hypothetical protein VN030_14340 [Cellvibrio sp.]|nr:hypothetical protein [Cellvibrio sp.]